MAKLTNQSTISTEELKKYKVQGAKFKKLKNSQKARWNSIYACNASVFHLRKPLKEMMDREPQ